MCPQAAVQTVTQPGMSPTWERSVGYQAIQKPRPTQPAWYMASACPAHFADNTGGMCVPDRNESFLAQGPLHRRSFSSDVGSIPFSSHSEYVCLCPVLDTAPSSRIDTKAQKASQVEPSELLAYRFWASCHLWRLGSPERHWAIPVGIRPVPALPSTFKPIVTLKATPS